MQLGKALGKHRANDPEQVIVNRLLLTHSSMKAVVEGDHASFPAACLADPDTDVMLDRRTDPLTMVGAAQPFNLQHPEYPYLIPRVVRAVRHARDMPAFAAPAWLNLFDTQQLAMNGVTARRFHKATLHEGSRVYSRHCHRYAEGCMHDSMCIVASL